MIAIKGYGGTSIPTEGYGNNAVVKKKSIIPQLMYPTSLLWAELKAVAWALTEQADRLRLAEKQLYMNTAEADWLDYWGSFFGVSRLPNEADNLYANRIKQETIKNRINNLALEQMIFDVVGYNVEVKDLGHVDAAKNTCFGVYLYKGDVNNLTDNEKQSIRKIVYKYKAAGTKPIFFAPAQMLITNDPTTTTNNPGYVTGPNVGGWTEVSF